MQNEKPVSTPLASHFKLSKDMCPETQEDIDYMHDSLFISSWKLDVCHGVYKTKYCTCSEICEKVYE